MKLIFNMFNTSACLQWRFLCAGVLGDYSDCFSTLLSLVLQRLIVLQHGIDVCLTGLILTPSAERWLLLCASLRRNLLGTLSQRQQYTYTCFAKQNDGTYQMNFDEIREGGRG